MTPLRAPGVFGSTPAGFVPIQVLFGAAAFLPTAGADRTGPCDARRRVPPRTLRLEAGAHHGTTDDRVPHIRRGDGGAHFPSANLPEHGTSRSRTLCAGTIRHVCAGLAERAGATRGGRPSAAPGDY